MNKEIVNQVKNSIYEAEGLLELLQLRPEKHGELAPLILKRIDEARALFVSDKPVSVAEIYEDEVMATAGIDDSLSDGHDSLDDLNDLNDHNDAGTEISADNAALDDEPLAKPQRETPARPAKVTFEAADDESRRTSPAFCLNDRYRFRRAIFGGSDAEFNATMDHVATLDGIEEAEDFFYGDMGLDPEDQDVADFMDIIRNYFA